MDFIRLMTNDAYTCRNVFNFQRIFPCLKDVWVNYHCIYSSALSIFKFWLLLLMTDCRESSFFSSRKGLHAISSSSLMKKNDETKSKITWQSPNSQILICFLRKISNSCEYESRSCLIFSITRVIVLSFYILIDSDQNLSIGFLRKISTNFTKWPDIIKQIHIFNRFTPGEKSSESKISNCYKASIVSHSFRKHALIQGTKRYAKFFS